MAGTTPTFNKFANSPANNPLYSLDLSTVSGLSNFAVMFSPINSADAPASLTLVETWTQNTGLYLLLDNPITTAAQASMLVSTLTTQNLIGKIGFAWIKNATSATPTLLNFLPITYDAKANHYSVSQFSTIPFQNFTLGISQATQITLDLTNFNFNFNNVSFYAPTLFFALTNGAKFGRIGPSINSTAAQNVSNCFASLSFEIDLSVGCWQFQLTLEKNSIPTLPGDIDNLDVSCRFFVNGPNANQLLSYHYPILSTEDQPISFTANLDALNLLNPARSFFNLTDPNAAMGGAPPPVDTYYRNSFGQAITITPVDQTSKFIFAINQQNQTPAETDPLYLIPQGAFNIGTKEPAETFRFLCGFSDLEYFGTATLTGSQLYFLPGQNAYCSVDFKKPNQTIPPSQLLSNTITTAWVCLVPATNQTLQYYTQSTDLAFYTFGPGKNFMDYYEIPLGTLALDSPPHASTYIPLVSYAGISLADLQNNALDYKLFEYRVLSQARRNIVENNFSSAPLPFVPPVTVVTTQGIEATFSGAGLSSWDSLILAVDSTANQLQLQNIAQTLRLALLSNQVFLVINNQTAFAALCTAANMQLDMAGWTFLLSPETWQDNTVMILKFHNHSVETLVNDTSYWSLPNLTSNGTQAALQTFISETKSDTAHQSFYQNFLDIIADKDWNGILFLNTPISFTTFPPAFAMLMPGIDPSKMCGHHLGLNLTPVTNNNGVITLQESSMFGLVTYQDPNPTLTPNVDYQYVVTSLFVLLQNSQIERFSGTLILQINQLFGYSVVPANQPILLQGSAQSHKGHINCSFVSTKAITLQLTSAPPSAPIASTSAVNSVTIDQVVFSSLGQYKDANNNVIVAARFDMQGGMQFNSVGTFDVFSFDSAVYNHLSLDLQFYFVAPQNYQLNFNATHVTVNSAESTLRQSSFVSQFPMAITQVIANAAPSPELLGYIPISVIPSTWSSLMNQQWYGLVFNLNLGSLGSLAGKKNFTAQVLVAWSPPDQISTQATTLQDAVWVGIKLPGFDQGGNAIDFEGVLKLGLNAVWLQQEAGAYVLVFKDFALHLLSYALPSSAAIDLQLFGDPGNPASSLAWYGSYVKPD